MSSSEDEYSDDFDYSDEDFEVRGWATRTRLRCPRAWGLFVATFVVLTSRSIVLWDQCSDNYHFRCCLWNLRPWRVLAVQTWAKGGDVVVFDFFPFDDEHIPQQYIHLISSFPAGVQRRC